MQKLLFWLIFVFAIVFSYTITYAQSADDVLNSILTNSWSNSLSRGYTLADKEAIKFVSFSGKVLVLEVPLAKKESQTINNYYISWGPVSYQEIVTTDSSELLQKIQDSDTYKGDGQNSVYEQKDGKLFLSLPVDDADGDIYVTIAPLDESNAQGNTIEDYKVNSQALWSQVLADNFSNSNSDQAIANVSCLWTKDTNRVNLTWLVNTAMPSATEVEIYHRWDLAQGTMDLKWSPNISDKTFTMDTPHRKGQTFRLKPVDSNGTMVWNEIVYVCKPADELGLENSPTSSSVIPTPWIVVVPVTGPKEVMIFLFFFLS